MLLFNHYCNQNRSSVFIAKYIDNNSCLMLNNKELVSSTHLKTKLN